MITLPLYVFALALVSSFVAGLAVLDFLASLVDDKINDTWHGQRNAPLRLIIWGGIGVLIAAAWIATIDLIAAAILAVCEIFVIVGVVWYRHTHRTPNQPAAQPAQPPTQNP